MDVPNADRGEEEGVQKYEIFADVIYTWPPTSGPGPVFCQTQPVEERSYVQEHCAAAIRLIKSKHKPAGPVRTAPLSPYPLSVWRRDH